MQGEDECCEPVELNIVILVDGEEACREKRIAGCNRSPSGSRPTTPTSAAPLKPTASTTVTNANCPIQSSAQTDTRVGGYGYGPTQIVVTPQSCCPCAAYRNAPCGGGGGGGMPLAPVRSQTAASCQTVSHGQVQTDPCQQNQQMQTQYQAPQMQCQQSMQTQYQPQQQSQSSGTTTARNTAAGCQTGQQQQAQAMKRNCVTKAAICQTQGNPQPSIPCAGAQAPAVQQQEVQINMPQQSQDPCGPPPSQDPCGPPPSQDPCGPPPSQDPCGPPPSQEPCGPPPSQGPCGPPPPPVPSCQRQPMSAAPVPVPSYQVCPPQGICPQVQPPVCPQAPCQQAQQPERPPPQLICAIGGTQQVYIPATGPTRAAPDEAEERPKSTGAKPKGKRIQEKKEQPTYMKDPPEARKARRSSLPPEQLNFSQFPAVQLSFCDYFLKAEGGVASVVALSEYKLEFEKKCKDLLANMPSHKRKEAEAFFNRIVEVIQVKTPEANNTELKHFRPLKYIKPILDSMNVEADQELAALGKYHQYMLSVLDFMEERLRERQEINPDAMIDVETHLLAGVMSRFYPLFMKVKDSIHKMGHKGSEVVIPSEILLKTIRKFILACYVEIVTLSHSFDNALTSLSYLPSVEVQETYRHQMVVRLRHARHSVTWAARCITTPLLWYHIKTVVAPMP